MTRISRWLVFALLGALVLLQSGCAAAVPPLLMIPESTPRAFTYYSQGKPISCVKAGSVSVLVAADVCKLFGTDYLRVWMLYFNRSAEPALIDPSNAMVVRALGGGSSWVQSPELPYQLLAKAANERAKAEIATVFGAALQSMAATAAARPTTLTTTGTIDAGHPGSVAFSSETVVNDKAEKIERRQDAIGRQASDNLADIESSYGMFAQSLSAGALRKHTVFSDSGVNGYVYFPLGKFRTTAIDPRYNVITERQFEPASMRYVLLINVPGIVDSVLFVPGAGQ